MTCLCLHHIRLLVGPSSKRHSIFNLAFPPQLHTILAVKMVWLFQAPWGQQTIFLASLDRLYLASEFVLTDLSALPLQNVTAQNNSGACHLRPPTTRNVRISKLVMHPNSAKFVSRRSGGTT